MTGSFLKPYKHLIISFVIVFSLILMILSFFSLHLENDEIIYKTLAVKLAHLQEFSLRGSSLLSQLPKSTYATPLFFKPPVYFVYLALLYILLGNLGLSLSPVIAYVLLVFILYKTVLLITDSIDLSLKSLLITATSPLIIFSSQQIHLDLFVTTLVTTSLYFLVLWEKKKKNYHLLLSGLFLSLSTLTNYSTVIFYPIFIFFLLLYRPSPIRNLIKNIIILLISSLFIFAWLYNIFFIHHMSLAQLIDKPNSFALHHFSFLNFVYHRPFYFYFLNIFLINPMYLLFFTLINKEICRAVIGKFSRLFVFLLVAIFTVFISLTIFGITGGTYQMRYILISLPFFIILLTIIPFERLRFARLLFFLCIFCNFALLYYNLVMRNAELFNFFEIFNLLRF